MSNQPMSDNVPKRQRYALVKCATAKKKRHEKGPHRVIFDPPKFDFPLNLVISNHASAGLFLRETRDSSLTEAFVIVLVLQRRRSTHVSIFYPPGHEVDVCRISIDSLCRLMTPIFRRSKGKT